MRWNKLRHELIYTDSGYEIVFYLPNSLEEIGEDFEFREVQTQQQKYKLAQYLKSLYPNITIQTVKFMAGAILAAVIIMPAHPKNKIHAAPTEIVKTKDNVTLVMGNYYIKPEVEAFLYKDRVMIPLRALSEVFGADVSWNEKSKMVNIKRNSDEIKLWIGSKWAVSNKTEFNLDAEPIIISGRTMVPLRFVIEAFGIDVDWEQKSNTVIIDYEKEFTLDYLVKPGDTLTQISNTFGVSVDNLRLWNNIKDYIIYSGQFIRVASPSLEPIINSMDKIEIKEFDFDTVLGYTVKDYPTHTSSYTSLNKYYNRLTEVSTFTHKLEADGSLKTEYMQNDIINFAKQKGINTTMLVHNADSSGFNKELAKSVLESQAKRQNLINNIYNQLKKYDFDGVEIDLENLPPESRQSHNQFIKELSQKLKNEGYTISCALPAKTSDDNEDWLKAYDYETIGKYADRILIMSYDQHWSGGSPGPIASIEWVDRVARYTASVIEPSKVLLGIAAYGYDWPVDGGKGKAVTVSNINDYLNKYGGKIEWNESSKSPYYKYKDNKNKERIIWFENAQSNQFKFELVKKYGFKGIGIWRLGLESSDFFSGLKSKS